MTAEEQHIFTFPGGVPGFWNFTRFLLLPHPDNALVAFLQSTDVNGPRFVLVSASSVAPDYQLVVEPWDIEKLFPSSETAPESQLERWFIISAHQPNRLTVNMLAPVVVSRSTRRGVQAVRADSRYSSSAPLDAMALMPHSGLAC